VVLDEAVLSRPVGGDQAMRDQLMRLVEAARLPNVIIQILLFAAGPMAAWTAPPRFSSSRKTRTPT
jgi:hypothetical protein